MRPGNFKYDQLAKTGKELQIQEEFAHISMPQLRQEDLDTFIAAKQPL